MLFLSLFHLPVANMESQEEIVGPYKFGILFAKNVPHILEKIFFSLDYEHYKTCLKVSSTWRDLLTSEFYVEKATSVFSGVIFPEEKLWQAAKEGNVWEVQILSAFVNVNIVNTVGRTPLHYAAWQGNIDVLKLLLERGAHPDLVDDQGWTQLHYAIRRLHCNEDVVQHLLDRGANPNSVNKSGWTPLHDAIRNGQKDVVQILLNAGAEPDKVNGTGETPLQLAQNQVVQLLLNAGAEKNICLCPGQEDDRIEIVNILNDALKQH